MVRFDETPSRLIFWRGTSYIPAWVTENGIWYTNEFYETQVPTMPTSAEPMADKQARFSHPRIIESNDARVVVLWRYAPVSVHYELVNVDPLTGWGDWVEETYTVYPEGSCVRKIKVWSSKPRLDPSEGREWSNFRQYHEAIVINPPGTRPEDNIRTDALTLANMKGEVHTYSWADGPPGEKASFDAETLATLHRISDLDTPGHQWLVRPAGGNILRVNLKARSAPTSSSIRGTWPSTAMPERSSGSGQSSLVEPLAGLPADPLERPLGPGPRPGLAQLPGPHPIVAAL